MSLLKRPPERCARCNHKLVVTSQLAVLCSYCDESTTPSPPLLEVPPTARSLRCPQCDRTWPAQPRYLVCPLCREATDESVSPATATPQQADEADFGWWLYEHDPDWGS